MQRALRYPRDEAEGELAEVRSEQDRQQDNGAELQAGEALHDPLEELVAADADDRRRPQRRAAAAHAHSGSTSGNAA